MLCYVQFQVGTLRYMAPEVLEGAVNLRECETALKQIDVYALGLVLWELCTRCSDWYPTAADADSPTMPPSYMAPYEAEIGKHPTFEHMQILVSRHKVRPQFPSSWGGTAASARLARETCEECWDHDAEARLTVMCAVERLNELSVLGPTAQCSRPMSPAAAAATASESMRTTTINVSSSSGAGGTPPHNCIQAQQQNQNLYQNDVTTSIITPPNQILPTSSRNDVPILLPSTSHYAATATLAKVITIGAMRSGVFNGGDNDEYDNDGGNNNSVEELLSSCSASESCDSVPSVTVAGSTQGTTNAGHRTSRRGWYGVRALIQKNLFKRNGTTAVKKSGSANGSEPSVSARSSPSRVHNNHATPVVPLVVQLRPSHLMFEQQQQEDLSQTANVIRTATSTATHNNGLRSTIENLDSSLSSAAHVKHINSSHTPRIVISKSATTMLQTSTSAATASPYDSSSSPSSLAEQRQIKRQRSLDMFHEVFGAKGSIERLRDPAQRVKTPGDVPAAVRRMRASKTLSLYDDRMMSDPTTMTAAAAGDVAANRGSLTSAHDHVIM